MFWFIADRMGKVSGPKDRSASRIDGYRLSISPEARSR